MGSWSKEKQRAYTKQHYQDHREQYIARSKHRYQSHREECLTQMKKHYLDNRSDKLKQMRQLRRKIKQEVLSYYSSGSLRCARCGIDDIDVLCLDHIEGGGTQQRRLLGNPSSTRFYYWVRGQGYPLGFQVLCANCNLKKRIREAKENAL